MGTASEGPADDFDALFDAAVKRGDARRKADPFAESIGYDPVRHEFVVRLVSGESFGMPVARIPELSGATPDQLAQAGPIARGEGIRWEALDLDLSTLTLITRTFGEVIQRAQARKAGSARSAAKAAAAKANGARGGRPRGGRQPRTVNGQGTEPSEGNAPHHATT